MGEHTGDVVDEKCGRSIARAVGAELQRHYGTHERCHGGVAQLVAHGEIHGGDGRRERIDQRREQLLVGEHQSRAAQHGRIGQALVLLFGREKAPQSMAYGLALAYA